MSAYNRHHPIRQQLAQTAARIMAEDGYSSFHQARQKAAHRLGVSNSKLLPDNQEIEEALIAYRELFSRSQQHTCLSKLRQVACEAMRFLQAYSPRLVGPVLKGTAGEFNPITLHIFCESTEEIAMLLQDNQIPYEMDERQLKMNHNEQLSYPLFRFIAEDRQIELIIFPTQGQRQAPLSSVDNRPMRRANLQEVETLLNQPHET